MLSSVDNEIDQKNVTNNLTDGTTGHVAIVISVKLVNDVSFMSFMTLA